MFIPYENIGNFLFKIFKNNKLKDYFYNKKIQQNINYVKKNKPLVINKIQNKLKNNKKINIVFYVYDKTKWKCQSLYDLFLKDERFNPLILVTKTAAKNLDNPSYQTIEEVVNTYEFFKNKKLNVKYAYDIKKEKFISFEKFKPDIIFYQHPWYIETSQGPTRCSKFALSAYIPYYFPIETLEMDYYLRFYKYINYYFVFDKQTKEKYAKNMENNGENLFVSGYPLFDNFKNNSNENEYIIYAPHWSVNGIGLGYSTFDWSGKYILEYAKKSNQKWIFKPHPLLFKALIDNKIMTKKEAKEYYEAWDEIGIRYESGDYLELFNKSKMMITDCGSFLGEYFATKKPLIHLISENSKMKNSNNPILKTYFSIYNLEELEKHLQILPENDILSGARQKLYNEMNFDENAAENILNIILKDIQI